MLSYGLLALLTHESQSGYDLMLNFNRFSHTTHSRVYPTLKKLEEKEFVTYTSLNQTDKPNKKIYSITPKGIEALKEWFVMPNSKPILKDESLLKIKCFHLMDRDSVKELLDEKLIYYKDVVNLVSKYLDSYRDKIDLENIDFSSKDFTNYIFLKKIISFANCEIEWYEWVKDLYKF